MGNRESGSRIPHGRIFLLLFLLSFMAGVLFGCSFGEEYQDYAGILSEYYLNRYKYTELVKEELFFYLLKERLYPTLLLMLFSFTKFGVFILTGYFMWQGFSFGTLLTLGIIRFGGKGILLCLAGMIPQYFLYVPVIFLLLKRTVTGTYATWRGRNYIEILAGNFVLFLLFLAGVLLETTVNPEMIHMILKIL